MTAPETALLIFVAVQAAGAMPEPPQVTGWFTYLWLWFYNTAQGIARNKDKLP